MSNALTADDAAVVRSVWDAAGIRVIGDGIFYPDLLQLRDSIEHWSEWLSEWSELGRRYEELGHRAERSGCAGISASSSGSTAREEKERAQRTKVAPYRRAAPLLQPPAERLEIQYDGIRIPGFLRLPPGVQSAPCVILIGGFDSTKEESYHFENACLPRGLATFAFDERGQGECYFERSLIPDFERYASAVIDHLQGRPEINAEQIGVLGRSLGGYYAVRSAASESRLKACAIFGALASIFHFDSLPPQTQLGFEYVTGLADREAGRARAQEYIDLGDMASEIQQPLFVLHGALDILISDSQARDLHAAARSEDKHLWVVADGIHCAHNRYHLVRRPLADWLASRLGAIAARAIAE